MSTSPLDQLRALKEQQDKINQEKVLILDAVRANIQTQIDEYNAMAGENLILTKPGRTFSAPEPVKKTRAARGALPRIQTSISKTIQSAIAQGKKRAEAHQIALDRVAELLKTGDYGNLTLNDEIKAYIDSTLKRKFQK